MRSRVLVILANLFLLLLIGAVHFMTGPELGFFIFYLLPVSIAAWLCGRSIAIAFTMASATIWLVADSAMGTAYTIWFAPYWNAAVRLITFAIVAVALSRIKESLDRERDLNASLSHALGQVKTLSGLLPICASCKSIRDDSGYWQQVEVYIRKHSDATFTHGACPDCIRDLYPEYSESDPSVAHI